MAAAAGLEHDLAGFGVNHRFSFLLARYLSPAGLILGKFWYGVK
jgi:hypothetical protein